MQLQLITSYILAAKSLVKLIFELGHKTRSRWKLNLCRVNCPALTAHESEDWSSGQRSVFQLPSSPFPLCPAIPEGQRLVVFWPLVCPLMNRDGLNLVLSSFSKSFWRLLETGSEVPVLASWVYCFCVESKIVLCFLKLLKHLKSSYHEVSRTIWLSVFSFNIRTLYE
jgi:hypothetical protein